MGLKQQLAQLFNQFNTSCSFVDFKTFSSGHINDTYLIITNSSINFVLQRINSTVFKNPVGVIENKVKITNFLLKKGVKTIQFVSTSENTFYVKSDETNYWCLSHYIENSQTYLKVNSKEIAYQAGFITGKFLACTSEFKENIVDILPRFHSMSFRFEEFSSALNSASELRKEKAKKWIDFALTYKEEMFVLENAILNKEIPLRITHNDTKISNILFDNNQNAICLIDLDTVMNGCIHFDYGDALRTICSTANEDETDLNKIDFNFDYFKQYTQGFFQSIKHSLTHTEINHLAISPKIMTFIIGLRFLTDYLNNNIYYKIKYSEHNLDRAINQFTLVKKLQKQQFSISNYIRSLI